MRWYNEYNIHNTVHRNANLIITFCTYIRCFCKQLYGRRHHHRRCLVIVVIAAVAAVVLVYFLFFVCSLLHLFVCSFFWIIFFYSFVVCLSAHLLAGWLTYSYIRLIAVVRSFVPFLIDVYTANVERVSYFTKHSHNAKLKHTMIIYVYVHVLPYRQRFSLLIRVKNKIICNVLAIRWFFGTMILYVRIVALHTLKCNLQSPSICREYMILEVRSEKKTNSIWTMIAIHMKKRATHKKSTKYRDSVQK